MSSDIRKTDNPTLITPSELISALPSAFEHGLANGDLLFFESTTSKHSENGIEFEIRRCPALLHKPALPAPHFPTTSNLTNDAKGQPEDPFAPPYPKGLCVGRMNGEDDSEYVVMLNKYRCDEIQHQMSVTNMHAGGGSVVKHHFLLITKEFQSQATPPTPSDLVLAYQILIAAYRAHQPFLAFFNCGDRSGASQHHKHLQFIPLDPNKGGPPFEDAAKAHRIEVESTPFSLPNLPYAHYTRRLPSKLAAPSVSADTLYEELINAFLSTLDLAFLAVRHDPAEHPPGTPSYNVLLTPEHLTVIPRSCERYPLPRYAPTTGSLVSNPSSQSEKEKGDDLPSPSMSINSLGYAGMFLVKSEEEAEAVMREGIVTMLRGVGVPRMADVSLAEPQNRDYVD